MKKIIIIGGNAAGMSALSQARRDSNDFELTLYERSPYISYSACGIPYYISGEIKNKEDLFTYNPEKAREKFKADIFLETELLSIDENNKSVKLKDLNTDRVFEDFYDKLIIATGTSPVKLPIEGIELENIFYLRNLADGDKLKSFLDKENPKKVLIVGSGHIGMEMADSFNKIGMDVYLNDITEKIMVNIDQEFAGLIFSDMEQKGIKFLLGSQVEKFIGDKDNKVKSVIVKGEEYHVDMVLIAAGTAPNSTQIKEIGLKTGDITGYICVDEYMRTTNKDIYAAGDCIEVKHILKEHYVHRPLAVTANRTGRVAGHSVVMDLMGMTPSQSFKGILSTFATEVFGWQIAVTGLSEDEIIENGFEYITVTGEHNSKAGYFPGKSRTHTKIFVDKNSGKVLGVQMVGKDGEARRINVFVAAITSGMTVEDIYNLDTVYSPPFSPVYDPVIYICGKAMLELKKLQV